MKCLSTNTTSGTPCQRTVGRDGCPHHGNYHIQQRLREANRPTVKPMQLELHMPISRDRINQLIMIGYKMDDPDICGCQG